jgi:hypothetical protein
MGDRFQHAQHLLRVAILLALGLVVFLIARRTLIPSDFGVYGYYRAGALNDIRAQPIAYAGRAACNECHDGAYDPPEPEEGTPARKDLLKPLTVDDNKHAPLRCEACHGPLQKHIDDTEKDVPKITTGDRLCLGCHLELRGRPKSQPQIVPAVHEKDGPKSKEGCVACHTPHWPKVTKIGDLYLPVAARAHDAGRAK